MVCRSAGKATLESMVSVKISASSKDLCPMLIDIYRSVGPIPSLVLHLHMLYHTAMIILHRPPRNLFKNPKIATSQDVKICYESLEAIIKLLRIYSRNYQFSHLPFTFVHILASAASIILMKRFIEGSSWDAIEVAKPLGLVIDAIEAISQTWPCANQVRAVIDTAMKSGSGGGSGTQSDERNESPESFDLMTGIPEPVAVGDIMSGGVDGGGGMSFDMSDVDVVGLYMQDDEYLDVPFHQEDGLPFHWNENSFQ